MMLFAPGGDEYYYNIAQAAVTNGTRDAILGMIGGGDVAILGVLWLILKCVREIRDEIKGIHTDQQEFYREMRK